ncbi:DUF4279 domain-containing protein [Aliterella atlantica]|uniref:DUF4279 domain-containing protein n=1 Tax=Aliterella atlantica CENA595 TaxID=1618023 RepID=A0A0D8ZRT7_9CYAN|nr:DUF4279 domain-containing protein [Aliterella atlantica]KJH71199.1 hypothetical protein UH38_14435 [Aliterella atlantica CENA595]
MQYLALSAAISEVLRPTLGVTQQVLAVHKLVVQDGKPLILLVDEKSELGAYYIYFGIEDQPYHFVVVIREEQKTPIASAAYIEASVRVYLAIASTTLAPDTITEKVKLNPTSKRLLGEPKNPRNPRLKFKEHRWYFEPQKNVPGSLETKLKFLLDRLEPAQEAIANLQNNCETSICICYKGYRGWMSGWHIDKATMRKIVALGAEVDLDLYAYGEQDLP